MPEVLTSVVVAALLGAGAQDRAATPTDPCAALAALALPQAKVTFAGSVPAGEFSPPPALSPVRRTEPSLFKELPRFCRVTVRAAPSAGSAIEIEVWMPAEGWNGRFRGQGNGGFAGEVNFRALAGAVRQGYATAGTN